MRAAILGDDVMRIAAMHHQIPIPLSERRVARTNLQQTNHMVRCGTLLARMSAQGNFRIDLRAELGPYKKPGMSR
jgi:hypothetical protein